MLREISIRNHPILNNIEIPLINQYTKKPYKIVVFVGENGCGKTTLLNELFNINTSKYFLNCNEEEINPLYLRQNLTYISAQNKIMQVINGKDNLYPIANKNINSPLDLSDKMIDVLRSFNDKNIEKLHISGDVNRINFGGEAFNSIAGNLDNIDVSTISSGELEILQKLNNLRKISSSSNIILIDEPENSLHPRWQKIIIDAVINLMDQDGIENQFFIATHSEKVLESLINLDDVILLNFKRIDDNIDVSIIDNNLLKLPKTTFGELDYIVFGIPTYDYHDQLLTYIQDREKIGYISDLDNYIKNHSLFSDALFKQWLRKDCYLKDEKKIKVRNNYKTLPIYIRNYFHHPHDGMEPTEDELIQSIEFLKKLI